MKSNLILWFLALPFSFSFSGKKREGYRLQSIDLSSFFIVTVRRGSSTWLQNVDIPTAHKRET